MRIINVVVLNCILDSGEIIDYEFLIKLIRINKYKSIEQ